MAALHCLGAVFRLAGLCLPVLYATWVLLHGENWSSVVNKVGIALLIATVFFVWQRISSAFKERDLNYSPQQQSPKAESREERVGYHGGEIFRRRHQRNAIAYCAICKELDLEPLNDLLLGRRFICPKWESKTPHIGAVISRDERGMQCWLSFQRWLMLYLTRWSSGGILRCCACCLRRNLGPSLRPCLPPSLTKGLSRPPDAVFVLSLWGAVLLALLFFLPDNRDWKSEVAFMMVVVYHIVDSLLCNTSVAFVTQQPRLPLRSIVLGGVAFLELSLAFAVGYVLLPKEAIHPPLPDRLTALSFSLVTITTQGYGGDFKLCTSAQILVMLEIVIGLYFLSTLFVTVVSWANQPDALPTLRQLREESRKLDEDEVDDI